MTATNSTCPCGSTLPAAVCCALDQSRRVRHFDPIRVGGVGLALSRNDPASAERACREILMDSPGETGALGMLARIRHAVGDAVAAEALLRRVVTLDPDDLVATQDLGLLRLARGDLAEAERHARNSIRLGPRSAHSHNLLGMVMTARANFPAGDFHYRRTLDLLRVREPTLLTNLAANLAQQGRLAEARLLFQEADAAAADTPRTLLGWARLEEADGRFEAAAALLDRLERLDPGDPATALQRAVLLSRTGESSAALARLDKLTEQDDRPIGNDAGLGETAIARFRPAEWLEKGRLLDRLGRSAEAFAAFVEGKRQLRVLSGHAYQANEANQLAERLKRFFVRARLAHLPRARNAGDGPRPVFVLGFPRSGTTLVEQMLSGHPSIAAGDELPLIGELAAILPRLLDSPLPYPEALVDLWMADRCDGLDTLRDHYLARVRQLGIATPGTTMFTDKMPLNEMHIGLIGLVFPQAPLLHLVRHPLDVVLSAFGTAMTHGFLCAYDLESVARHYVLMADLVEHYLREMDLPYRQVRYEDIVANPEAELRRMLDALGLPFDPACLAFHRNPRAARTASYAQVREPLYDRSRYRYRRYLPQLAPVIPIVEPVMQRLGYAID